jgi:hypothetical protein
MSTGAVGWLIVGAAYLFGGPRHFRAQLEMEKRIRWRWRLPPLRLWPESWDRVMVPILGVVGVLYSLFFAALAVMFAVG